jgi:hypothetical protein
MKHLIPILLRSLAASALILLVTTGCDRDGVKVYKVATNDTAVVPTPAATPMTMPATMPGGIPMPDNSGFPKLKYTLPEGWKEKPATQMRVASCEVSENGKTADVSVIPLPGVAGSDLANVNRWRGQVGLEPQAEADLKKIAEPVELAGQPGELYDLAGTSPGSGEPARILGVILHRDDAAWFFKMTGDAALVEKSKPAFVVFLKSVQFEALAAPSAMDMNQLPPSHPAIPGMDSGGGQPAEPRNQTP